MFSLARSFIKSLITTPFWFNTIPYTLPSYRSVWLPKKLVGILPWSINSCLARSKAAFNSAIIVSTDSLPNCAWETLF